jgi:hypothetical protein
MNSLKRIAFGALLCSLLVGCGKGVVVKGKVTDNGQPLTVSDKGVLTIAFHADDTTKAVYPADVKKDGTFEVPGPEKKGVPPGKYHIVIQQMDPYPKTDKLKGKFAPGKTAIVREVAPGKEIDIDVSKPEG